MEVFISWSGSRSKQIAEILTDWLPQVIQAVNPWMSKDIDKGARWNPEISEKLAHSKIGIICLTTENLHADWILFEAGALSKIKENKVCTFLKDLTPADIEQPLAQFQHTLFNKDDVKNLLVTINLALDNPLSDKTLNSVFDKNWPDLEEKINLISKDSKSKGRKPERADREILEEILELNRQIITEMRIQEEKYRDEKMREDYEWRKYSEDKRKLTNFDKLSKMQKLSIEKNRNDFLNSLIDEAQKFPKNMSETEKRQSLYDKILNSQFPFTSEEVENILDMTLAL